MLHWLCYFSIIAQVILLMLALLLVDNYVIFRCNHLARGDYNAEALISKWPRCDFFYRKKNE